MITLKRALIAAVLVLFTVASLAYAQGYTVKNYFAQCQSALCDNVLTIGGTLRFTGRGTVTQATSITTGVTVNATSGTITTVSQTIAAGAEATFTVTNSSVAANDSVIVSLASTASAGGPFIVTVTAVAAGSFDISIANPHATNAGNNTLVINFVVLKSAT